MRAAAVRGLALLAGTLAGACGYDAGLTLAPEYRTVGIEVFGNDTYERDLEREMHAAVTRAARDLVDASVVPPGRAGLVVRGKLLEYHRRGGIRSSDNVQLETGLTVRVEALLWDPLVGEIVAGPVRLTTQVGYTLDQEQPNEARARSRAVENLAERVVLELFTRALARRVPGGAGGPDDGSGAFGPALRQE